MKKHILQPNDFLTIPITAYYSLDFHRFGKPDNPDFLNIIKNDFRNKSPDELYLAMAEVVGNSILGINDIITDNNIDLVCIVPRSKSLSSYKPEQLYFTSAIDFVTNLIIEHNSLDKEIHGINDTIIRHTNTKTTHFHNKPEYGGDGDLPYPGITKNTCNISDKVKNKKILLIDDIYTKTINIDEDCIQALLDNGAKSVILYTVAKTISKF